MAYESRSGVCRANTTYMGLYVESPYISLNGTDVTSAIIADALQIAQQVGGNTATAELRGSTVTPGHVFEVRDGGVRGRLIFSGRVVRRVISMQRATEAPRVALEASDRWFLDRRDRVTATFSEQPVNGIVAAILRDHTDGWRPGQLATTVTAASFDNVPVTTALERLAAACGCYLLLTPFQTVSMVASVADGHPVTLDNTETDFWRVVDVDDVSQMRNRTTVFGQATAVAERFFTNATTISVDDGQIFDPDGGSAHIRGALFTYTGRTETTITGVSGLTTGGSVGDPIGVVSRVDDSASQTAFAATLGGGLSGIVAHTIKEDTATFDEVVDRATEDVARFKDAIVEIRYSTRSKFAKVLKSVTLNITSPITRNVTAVTDTVDIVGRGEFKTGQMRFDYHVTATPFRLTLEQVLERT